MIVWYEGNEKRFAFNPFAVETVTDTDDGAVIVFQSGRQVTVGDSAEEVYFLICNAMPYNEDGTAFRISGEVTNYPVT